MNTTCARGCDHLSYAGRLIVSSAGGWTITTTTGAVSVSGSGGLSTARDYVRRAMSGELRNHDIPGLRTECHRADVYALDWSHAPGGLSCVY